MSEEPVTILLVDDQPAKLLSYEVVLQELPGLNIIKATSARDALSQLLASEVAIVLMDVSMPELDGFQLAAMIREHPRFQRTAIIFVSGIHLDRVDFLRGYEMGAVDYVTVPVIPEVLRAKVRVFADLYRKTRELEQLNRNLEQRVEERTAEVEAASVRLRESEQRRSLALAAGQMGSWDWDVLRGDCHWDENQHRIFGVDPATFKVTADAVRPLIHPDDLPRLEAILAITEQGPLSQQMEFRICPPGSEMRWCFGTASASLTPDGKLARLSGVTIDITERKQAEERQVLLAREVDHRAKNALALVQTIIRLSHAETIDDYVVAVEGRIQALSRAHALLAESRWAGADLGGLVTDELAPYVGAGAQVEASGPQLFLKPRTAQTLALALHELSTNAAKYGSLSVHSGALSLSWERNGDGLDIRWAESNGPRVHRPNSTGFGLKAIVASIERQLDGKAVFEWRPDGLLCTLSIPIREVNDEGEAAPSPPVSHAPAPLSAGLPKRVMLVEDEVLLGLMMQDMLTDIGCSVVGPFRSVSEALPAARRDQVDFAVLDVNLGKDLVYPVAEALQLLSIPFVFVTGYGADSIDPRFRGVSVLGKPVDESLLRRFLTPAEVAATDPLRASRSRIAAGRG